MINLFICSSFSNHLITESYPRILILQALVYISITGLMRWCIHVISLHQYVRANEFTKKMMHHQFLQSCGTSWLCIRQDSCMHEDWRTSIILTCITVTFTFASRQLPCLISGERRIKHRSIVWIIMQSFESTESGIIRP